MKEYPKEHAEKYRREYPNRRRRRLISTVPLFFFAAIALIARLTAGLFWDPFSFAGPIAYVTLLPKMWIQASLKKKYP